MQLVDAGIAVLKKFFGILAAIWDRFFDDRCPRVAAALSFTSMLALVPLLTVGISAMSMFPVFDQWAEQFLELVSTWFVPETRVAIQDVVSQELNKFVGNAGKLTTFGLLFLLIASLLALSTIEDAFNDIWGVPRGRRLTQRVLVYWAVLSLGPLLIVTSLSISSYFSTFTNIFADSDTLRAVLPEQLKIVPFVLAFIAFLLLYTAVPNHDVAFRPAVVGALIAAIAFEGAKKGFALYLDTFDSYTAIYGALAALPIILLWVYLSWLIVLIGVEVVVVLSKDGEADGMAQEADT